jgi:predicted transcriptional regulator
MHFGSKPIKSNYMKSYSGLADLFRLFSKSVIWPILHSLRNKGMTLSEISKKLRMTQKAVLPELMALQSKDILISFSKSQQTYYRLADDRILQALDLMHKIFRRKVKKAERVQTEVRIRT